MSTDKAVGDILSTESIKANVTQEDVKNILLNEYGLKLSDIKILNGYDDKNFHVKVDKSVQNSFIENVCEDGYIFKVINSLDSKNIEFFNAQNSTLMYLGNRKICCPIPVKTKNGEYLAVQKFDNKEHIIRLLVFIPGTTLISVECTSMICYECGVFLANLNNTLKNFTHIGYENRDTVWMLANVPKITEFLFAVNDAKKQRMVTEVIQAFSSRVLPKSDKFEKGLIHGDFNEQNILLAKENDNWHVKGVLDFGDAHIACFLFDVAVAMTYIILEAKSIECGGYVLAGYNSVRPLSSEETELLKICVCARMCQSLVLGAFTYSRDPENIYVTRTGIVGWTMLEELWNLPEEVIIGKWIEIRDNYVPDK